MRSVFFLVLLLLSIVGSGYSYTLFDRTCKTPVTYRIGTIDARFNTSKAELIAIVADAEKIWEEPLEKDLFVYAEDGELPVNLIFDERQQQSEREEKIRGDLDTKEGKTERIAREYESRIATYRSLQIEYERSVQNYDVKLTAYNTDVDAWNSTGGVPQEKVAHFEQIRTELQQEKVKLEAMVNTLTDLSQTLNTVKSNGDRAVADFNMAVDTYNSEFSKGSEFTQGDYTRDAINVYQFNTTEELKIVLAHELGHALSLGHTENERSIMYPTQAKEVRGDTMTIEDRTEFERVCKERSFFEKVQYGLEKTGSFAFSIFSR